MSSALAQDQENWQTSQRVVPDVKKSDYHYLFLGIDLSGGLVEGGGLDVSHSVMTTGLRIIPRGRLVLVKDKAWVDPRAALGGDGTEVGPDERDIGQSFTVGKRTEVAHAQDIAYNLSSLTYRDTGLSVVASLTGIPEAVARWVELVLLPAKVGGVIELHRHLEEFDITEMPDFPDGPRWMGWRMSTGIVPSALVAQVRRELIAACATGETYMRTFYGDQRSEMQQAMVPNGKGGIAVVSEKLRLFIKELGLEPLDRLAATADRARQSFEAAAPGPMTLQMPAEVTDLIKLLIQQGFQITPPAATGPAAPPAAENWSSTSEPETPHRAESVTEDEKPTGKLEPAGETKTVEEKSKEEMPFAKCGAPKTDGNGTCGQRAGHGTDHPGTGHCSVHGG